MIPVWAWVVNVQADRATIAVRVFPVKLITAFSGIMTEYSVATWSRLGVNSNVFPDTITSEVTSKVSTKVESSLRQISIFPDPIAIF